MNYDFHRCFSPVEFERFICDILEIREQRKFESFGIGRDEGIDLRSESEGGTIICQVKCLQNNFSQLLSILRSSEVVKVRRLSVQRYILATSLSLLPQQKEKIRDLFGHYIQSSEDILGRDDLNHLLGNKAYHEVEKRHYKLWLTSSNILLTLLAAELRRGEYNETSAQLEEMKNQLPRYVQNPTFSESLAILNSRSFVIITGPPGIGKTMLGRALAAHFIERRNFEFVFVRSSVQAIWNQYIPGKRQIFLMDDFWGSVFARDPSNRNEDKSLLSFLQKIEGDSSKAFILTSREYVFQRGCQRQNYVELGRYLAKVKCMVTHESFSKIDRARILYNHLYFSNIPRSCLEGLIYRDRFLRVIEHRNYTPRTIEQFIDREFGLGASNGLDFADRFLEYLEDPYEYWVDSFEKQSSTAKLILLILAVSNPPIRWTALLKTLEAAVIHASTLGIQIDIVNANENLKELDQTFVIIKDYHGEDLTINFQNPSLVDVLIRYLSQKMDSWGRILLSAAQYFNQLDFAFTTRDDEYFDDGYVNYRIETSYGKKIRLRSRESEVLRSRFLTDFDSLGFTAVDPDDEEEYWQYSEPIETLAAKLIRFGQLFNLDVHADVRAFICDRYQQIERSLISEDQRGGVKEVLKDLPRLIQIVKPYLRFDGNAIVSKFYAHTTFVDEILAWAELEKIVPVEYRFFVAQNRREIKKHVRHLVLWDAEWYSEDDEFSKVDELLDWKIDAVFKLFNMRKSKTFVNSVKRAAEYSGYCVNKIEKSGKGEEEVEQPVKEAFNQEKVREEFAGLLRDQPLNYLTDAERDDLLDSLIVCRYERLIAGEKIRSERFSDIANDRLLFTLFCKHHSKCDFRSDDIYDHIFQLVRAELHSSLLEANIDIPIGEFLEIFANTCFEYYFDDKGAFIEKLQDLYRATFFKMDGSPVEKFFEALVPFFEIDFRDQWIVSDKIGMSFSCRYILKMESVSRANFYKNGFSRFCEEEYAMDWWYALFALDRKLFAKSFLIPLGESSIALIAAAPPFQRFLKYLNVIALNFDVIFETAEPNEIDSIGMSGSSEVVLFEFLDVGLDGWEIGDLFAVSMGDVEIELCANEIIDVKDLMRRKWEKALSEGKLARIDLCSSMTAEKFHIFKKLGESFDFESKFERLSEKFNSLAGN